MSLIDNFAPLLDNRDYPTKPSQYIGQARAVESLRLAAKSAKMRKAPMEHVFITHPTPGIGKTALAVLTANALGRDVRVVNPHLRPEGARLLCARLNDRDVLFVDEFHKVMDNGKKNAEWWQDFLQDGFIMGPRGPEGVARVTVIAATTDAATIPGAIRSRFPLQPPMVDYTLPEAAKIVTILSVRLLVPEGLPKVTGKDALAIATAAHANPRAITRHLKVLRDMVVAKRMKDGYDIPALLAFQGISPDGLDDRAREYLNVLALEFQGLAGGTPLADRLGGQIELTEQLLMGKGYIAKTRSGRVLTEAGIRRQQELEAS